MRYEPILDEHEPGRSELSKSCIDLDLTTILILQLTETETVPVSAVSGFGFPLVREQSFA